MATCRDPEGWRVVSDTRVFDLSLCFEEGIVLSSILFVCILAAATRASKLLYQSPRSISSRSRLILLGKQVRYFSLSVVLSVSLHHMTGATRSCLHSKRRQSYLRPVASQASRRTWVVHPGTTRIAVRSITNASQSLANALIIHNSPLVLAMLYRRGCDLDTVIRSGCTTCRSICS